MTTIKIELPDAVISHIPSAQTELFWPHSDHTSATALQR